MDVDRGSRKRKRAIVLELPVRGATLSSRRPKARQTFTTWWCETWRWQHPLECEHPALSSCGGMPLSPHKRDMEERPCPTTCSTSEIRAHSISALQYLDVNCRKPEMLQRLGSTSRVRFTKRVAEEAVGGWTRGPPLNTPAASGGGVVTTTCTHKQADAC